jgi:hypothetical protein
MPSPVSPVDPGDERPYDAAPGSLTATSID